MILRALVSRPAWDLLISWVTAEHTLGSQRSYVRQRPFLSLLGKLECCPSSWWALPFGLACCMRGASRLRAKTQVTPRFTKNSLLAWCMYTPFSTTLLASCIYLLGLWGFWILNFLSFVFEMFWFISLRSWVWNTKKILILAMCFKHWDSPCILESTVQLSNHILQPPYQFLLPGTKRSSFLANSLYQKSIVLH